MMTMPTEEMLRAILGNLIRCGQKDNVARKALAMKYPEQEGAIWDLDLNAEPRDVIRIKISNKEVNNFCFVEDNMMNDNDELVTDLDVSSIEAENTEEEITEEEPVVVKKTRKPRTTKTETVVVPVKKDTKITRARVLYAAAEDKTPKIIRKLFAQELDMTTTTAYIYARKVAEEFDGATPS